MQRVGREIQMAASNRRKRLLLLLLLRRRRRHAGRKRTWVRKINLKREKKGEYHALIQEMRLSDHDSFYKYFRMMPSRFDHLLSLVGPAITHQKTNFRSPVPPGERLAVTLRYLATRDSMQTIAFSYRLGHSIVCNTIEDTCDAIWDALASEYLRRPSNKTEWKKITEGFHRVWNFPHCLGAIDGKHVVLQAPPRAGSAYYNYKNTHSIVLMAVCDAYYCFTLVDVGDYGRHSDGGVLSPSNFGKAMENGSLSLPDADILQGTTTTVSYVFVGDAAFPLRTNMLRPYPRKFLQVFNYRLSRACRVRENTFGIIG